MTFVTGAFVLVSFRDITESRRAENELGAGKSLAERGLRAVVVDDEEHIRPISRGYLRRLRSRDDRGRQRT